MQKNKTNSHDTYLKISTEFKKKIESTNLSGIIILTDGSDTGTSFIMNKNTAFYLNDDKVRLSISADSDRVMHTLDVFQGLETGLKKMGSKANFAKKMIEYNPSTAAVYKQYQKRTEEDAEKVFEEIAELGLKAFLKFIKED